MSDERTELDYLARLLAERRSREARRVKLRDLRERPDVLLLCRVPKHAREVLDIDEQAEKMVKGTRDKDALPPEGALSNCLMLARFCEQITVDGRDMAPGDGSAFSYPPLQETLGVDRGWKAVRELFDSDDFVIGRLARALAEEIGAGGKASVVDDDEVDPT